MFVFTYLLVLEHLKDEPVNDQSEATHEKTLKIPNSNELVDIIQPKSNVLDLHLYCMIYMYYPSFNLWESMHEFFNRNYEINQFFKALSTASAFNMHFRFFGSQLVFPFTSV